MRQRAFYLVITDRQNDGPVLLETMVSKMDRATVARRIEQGHFETVARVIEFIPVAGTCRDVTDEFPEYHAQRLAKPRAAPRPAMGQKKSALRVSAHKQAKPGGAPRPR